MTRVSGGPRLEFVGPFRLERRILCYSTRWSLVAACGAGLTMTEIGRRFGVSRQRVAEVLDSAEVPRRGHDGSAQTRLGSAPRAQ